MDWPLIQVSIEVGPVGREPVTLNAVLDTGSSNLLIHKDKVHGDWKVGPDMRVGNRSRRSRMIPVRTGTTVNRMRAAVVSDPRWRRMGVDMVIGIAEITDWDGKNRIDYDKHRRIWATGKVPGVQLVRKSMVPMSAETESPSRDRRTGGLRDPLDLPSAVNPMVVNLILPPIPSENRPQPAPRTVLGARTSTPTGIPPSILHINLGGAGLVVPPQSEDSFIAGMPGETGVETKYKLAKIKDFLDEGGLAVCVAEAGVTGDTVSEGVKAALDPHRVPTWSEIGDPKSLGHDCC